MENQPIIDPITKKIQALVLEEFKAFSEVCQQNNLRFFAVSGTSIGVELWQGFVPWDDDMDLGMPIDDFEKFRTKIYKKLPEPFVFVEIPGFGGKIYNKNTTFIEAPYALNPSRYGGVFIDVVPLIGMPDDPQERITFQQEIRRFNAEAISIDRAPEISKISGQSPKKILKWRQDLIERHPFGTTKYCTDFSCEKCPLYLTEGFLNPTTAKFEGLTIPISSRQSEDLEAAYGKLVKYMPKDLQSGHHDFTIFYDLEKPYSYYAKSFNKIKIPNWFRALLDKEHYLSTLHMREAALQKTLAYNSQIQLIKALEENDKIHTSQTYRIGQIIVKPFKILKSFLKK